MIKIILSLIYFYFLGIIQTSFLVHCEIRGGVLNIILLSIILFNFFEKKKSKTGFFIGAIGGFYLDIFSPYFPGIFTLLGITIALLICLLKPFFETKKFASFCIILLIVLLFYEGVLSLLTLAYGFHFDFSDLIYNFLVAILAYFLIKFIYVFRQKRIKK